nr:hypothetical protein [Tanacetum cinerariifolium]
MEQMFKISKCAEEDKVKFAVCTFKGRVVTWWNVTEIQKMEQELWTMTVKGDDIKGFPKRVKVNVTLSKPASLHDAINMAHELVEQSIQAKATMIGESNKRKWDDHQRNNNNNNHKRNVNTHHQQQNKRQKAGKAYVAAPAEGRGYAENLPRCNHCNSHHNGVNSLEDVTCYGYGEKGHFRNLQNEGARGRAYVMRIEDPRQNPNVVVAPPNWPAAEYWVRGVLLHGSTTQDI